MINLMRDLCILVTAKRDPFILIRRMEDPFRK